MESWTAGTTKCDSQPIEANADECLSPEAQFECDVCQKRFTRAFNLKNHHRSHTDERPFACKVCGNRFRRQYDCKTHQALHSGIKKYECSGSISGQKWGCHRKFARESSLGRHKMSTKACQCLRRSLEQLSDRAVPQLSFEVEAPGAAFDNSLSTSVTTLGVPLRPHVLASTEMLDVPRPATQKLLSQTTTTTQLWPPPSHQLVLREAQGDWDFNIPLLAEQNPTEEPSSFTVIETRPCNDQIRASNDSTEFPGVKKIRKNIDRTMRDIDQYCKMHVPAAERESFGRELRHCTIELEELNARLYGLHLRVLGTW